MGLVAEVAAEVRQFRRSHVRLVVIAAILMLLSSACGAVNDFADGVIEGDDASDTGEPLTDAVAFADDGTAAAVPSVTDDSEDEAPRGSSAEEWSVDAAQGNAEGNPQGNDETAATNSPTSNEVPTTEAPTTSSATPPSTTTAPAATLAPTTSAAPAVTVPPAAPSWPSVDTPNITGPEYVLELDRWNINNDGTEPQLTRANFQSALDWAHENGYGTVKVPAGVYLIGEVGNDIYFDGIDLHSNTALVLDDRAEIRLATNDKWNSCAITIANASNVAVIGGQISGDRNTHIYTPRASDGSTVHDEGHNICVQSGSNNVLIEGVHLRQANGDGILLVGNNSQGEVHDITIRNNDIDGNRRQGISIVGAQQVLIEGNDIHHTEGTSPQFGIDIESLSFDSRDIIIRNNRFYNNRGGDIVNTDGSNVLVEGNLMRQGEGNQYIDGPLVSWPRGDWTVRGNTIRMVNGSVNGKSGFIGYSGPVDDREAATSYFVNNVCHGCGMYVYNSENIVVRGNTFNGGYIVMQHFENAVIENNEVNESSQCWAYRFRQVTGSASGNTYNGEPFDIPLTDVPWDGCWVN